MATDETSRTCKRCHVEKPLEAFHWARGGDRRNRLYSCKVCILTERRDYKRPNPPRRDKERLRLWQAQRRAKDPDGYRAYMAEWRAKNPAAWRAHNTKTRLKRYGLTPAQFASLAQHQHGECAICAAMPKTLHVDHCHSTGKVRGLLCAWCNTGLGYFRDETETLSQAILYLQRHT